MRRERWIGQGNTDLISMQSGVFSVTPVRSLVRASITLNRASNGRVAFERYRLPLRKVLNAQLTGKTFQ